MTETALKPVFAPFVVEERYSDAVKEAMPLIRAHGNELGLTALPHPWRPALNLYAECADLGNALWFSVRNEDLTLVGYALYLFCPSTLFAGKVHAILEAIYLKPEYRTVALLRQLWHEGDAWMRKKGIASLSWSLWTRRGGRKPKQVTHWRFY